MRRLILLRHAKTEKTSESGLDRDRRLDERGRGDAARMGRFIHETLLVPDLVLVSPAVRAQETWTLVGEELATTPPVETVADLYGADATQLLALTRRAGALGGGRTIDSVMIVAHNPGLHEYGMTLTASGSSADRGALNASMPTATIAVLDFRIDDWSAVAFRTAHLACYVSPNTVDAAAS